jgi:hypothetical protein
MCAIISSRFSGLIGFAKDRIKIGLPLQTESDGRRLGAIAEQEELPNGSKNEVAESVVSLIGSHFYSDIRDFSVVRSPSGEHPVHVYGRG